MDALKEILRLGNSELRLYDFMELCNKGYSDSAIGRILHLPRHRVNRIRRRLFKRVFVLHDHVEEALRAQIACQANRIGETVEKANIIRVKVNGMRQLVARDTAESRN